MPVLMLTGACPSSPGSELPGKLSHGYLIGFAEGGEGVHDLGKDGHRHAGTNGDGGFGNPVIGASSENRRPHQGSARTIGD